MIAKTILLVLASICLVQCSSQPRQHSEAQIQRLTNADAGKVLNERYYEVRGVRKVERRILVTASPRLETKLETRTLGPAW